MLLKTAVVLHGNLRTFFMPLREDRNLRICDLIYSNIIKHNNADVFLVTDTSDFYLNGIHYFDESMRDKIKDTNSTMFHDVINFIETNKARELLTIELNKFDVKAIEIQSPVNITENPKFLLLSNAAAPDKYGRVAGSFSDRIVNQYYKIKSAYDLLQKYEQVNSIQYDLIFKVRLDALCNQAPLDIRSFDFNRYDVFVPGVLNAPIVYDWSAFGVRKAMDLILNLYNQLGFTLSERLYRCECKKCKKVYCGPKTKCKCNTEMEYEEMTLSSEYHLFKLFKDNNIKYASSNYPMAPYRYR